MWRVEAAPSSPRNPWSHTSGKSPVAEPECRQQVPINREDLLLFRRASLGDVSSENCPLLLLMGKNSFSVRASANKIFLMRILRRNS